MGALRFPMFSKVSATNAAWDKLWDWLLSDDELPEPEPPAIVPRKIRLVKEDDNA